MNSVDRKVFLKQILVLFFGGMAILLISIQTIGKTAKIAISVVISSACMLGLPFMNRWVDENTDRSLIQGQAEAKEHVLRQIIGQRT